MYFQAVVLEGKYWKRKLHAVTAEYKKWRMFHRHHSLLHQMSKDTQDTVSGTSDFEICFNLIPEEMIIYFVICDLI